MWRSQENKARKMHDLLIFIVHHSNTFIFCYIYIANVMYTGPASLDTVEMHGP